MRPIPVQVTVNSRITTPYETDTMTLSAGGMLRLDGDEGRLTYTEEGEGKTLSTLTWQGGTVTVSRTGSTRTYMELTPGTAYDTLYEVPPYRFDMTVCAKEVYVGVGLFGGRIRLEYDRSIGGEESRVAMDIEVEVKQ